ncbi:F0F1 ATP synthase subunit A [Devosia sp. ZB163]|uniref:F0F1 ATP synthase subunit A n=1 Tax=Devosia sp. ZB163 TaxID=3025938 RepID=UPI00235F3752|nr:F0F1 ATP synthase subunit A [Devosia sp. ZB163]MDC9823760.1 F0F1 ATP synthase subunit A [Devosia sp. ZB163]
MADPIHQFVIEPIFPLPLLAGQDLSFSNASAYMVLTVAAAAGFMVFAGRKRQVVPDRLQLVAEMAYEGIERLVVSAIGREGMPFFPLVFSLFSFILVANMIGMFPFAFTVTAQIIVTGALAMLVFGVVTVYGVWKHGFKFLKLFAPGGIPPYLLPIIVPIEVISYLSRPISHSVRLFAVMLAGHITLKVFAGFIVDLSGLGPLGMVATVFPLFMVVAITALEVLMAAIQAYVFAMLTCMYLNDALHPAH